MTDERKISVLHPVRSLAGAAEHRALWLAAAESPAGVEWITQAEGTDAVHKLNVAARQSTGDVLLFVADDLFPCAGWDAKVLSALPAGVPAVLSIPDGLRGDDLPTHPAVTREWYEETGWFFCPAYSPCGGMYADNDIQAHAESRGAYIRAQGFAFDHRHWLRRGNPTAEQLAMNSEDNYARGKAIFRATWRKQYGRVAIGVRVGSRPDPEFFACWTRLLMEGLEQGDVVLPPAIALPHSCAANAIGNAFLETDCDSLLLVDDDMVFRPNSLRALRVSPGKHDVVTGFFATRRAPYAPVALMRDESNERGTREADLEAGGVVPVDYVGFAFTLIKRAMIDKDCFEWTNKVGEDGRFSERVAALGGTLAVNTGVEIGHRTAVTVRAQLR